MTEPNDQKGRSTKNMHKITNLCELTWSLKVIKRFTIIKMQRYTLCDNLRMTKEPQIKRFYMTLSGV